MTAEKTQERSVPPPLPKRRSAVAAEEVSQTSCRSAFGKFFLVASIGSGGMGDVSLAVTEGSMGVKKLVVVKRLLLEHATNPGAKEMFLDEGRLAVRLNHPNVVQTYEVGLQEDNFFIAMEYLEGQSLNRVASRVLSSKSEALRGLHYAHELTNYDGTPLNIVHRDLSPQNLFITYDGVVKIVDFGIAKSDGQAAKTQLGMIKGKVAYMAPEQVDPSNEIDRRADIFVLGIVLWELVTGHRLMKGNTVLQTFQRIALDVSPRASSVAAGVDPALDAIIARALEKRPENRFQTAQEMRDALESYIDAVGGAWQPDRLGRIVSELFADHRTQVREQIRSFMTSPTEGLDPDDLPRLSISELEGPNSGDSIPLATQASVNPSVEIPRSPGRIKVAVLVAAVFCATGLAFSFVRGPVDRLDQIPPHSAAPAVAATEVAAARPEQRTASPTASPSSAADDDASSDDSAHGKRRAESRKPHAGRTAHVPWPQVPPPVSAPIALPVSPVASPTASTNADSVPQEAASAAAVATRGRKFRRTF
jgi:serine/threonine-protein kinase